MEGNLSGAVEGLMAKLKELVETETIIGKPIIERDGLVVIPVSKVSFGFGLGGDEAAEQNKRFHLGSGAGGSVVPMGFLVIDESGARVVEIGNTTQIEGLINAIPGLCERVLAFFKKNSKGAECKEQSAECKPEVES